MQWHLALGMAVVFSVDFDTAYHTAFPDPSGFAQPPPGLTFKHCLTIKMTFRCVVQVTSGRISNR